MEILMLSVNAILPTFILIGIGMVVKKFNMLSESAVKEFNVMSFNLFMPVMFFKNIYDTGGKIDLSLKLIVLILIVHVIEFVIAMLLAKLVEREPNQNGVIQQATFRSNMILFGTAIATVILTPEELGTYSVAMMFILPIQNLGSAVAQSIYSTKEEQTSVGQLLKDIVLNPMNYGVIVGYIFGVLGIEVPTFAMNIISQLSASALPLGSILLGASLSVGNIGANLKPILATTVVKLIVLPALTVPLIPMFNLPLVESFILLMLCAAPSATMTYTIAIIEDWDIELACEIIIICTVVSFFTMTFWISMLLRMV